MKPRVSVIVLGLLIWGFFLPQAVLAQTTPQYKYVYHTVEKGNTLYSLSRQYHQEVETLRMWNNLPDNTILPGQQLIVGQQKVGEADPGAAQLGPVEPAAEVLYSTQLPPPMLEPALAETSSVATIELTASGGEAPVIQEGPAQDLNFPWVEAGQEEPAASSDLLQPLLNLKAADEAHFEDVKSRVLKLAAESAHEDWLMLEISGEIESSGEGLRLRPNGFRDGEDLQLPIDSLFALMREIPLKKLVVWDVNLSREMVQRYFTSQARSELRDVAFLTTCWNQEVGQPATWVQGAIANAFEEAMEGAADMDRDGRVSLQEADIYLNDRVKELTGNQQFAYMPFHQFREKSPVLVQLR